MRSLVLLLILVWASLVVGQDNAETEVQSKTIELTVYPKALDENSFGLKLLPTEVDIKEGNAAVVLLRMRYEQDRYMEQVASKFDEWLERPLDDPDVNNGIQFGSMYKQLKRAAYIRDADWNYPIDEDESRIGILLPDVQTGRTFVGKGLPLYIRTQIAQGRANEGREAILVGLACSRHYARTPLLVCGLIGNSCAIAILDQADMLLQVESSENLYWAYQKLPRPLVGIEHSASLETEVVEKSIPELRSRPWPSHEDEAAWTSAGSQITVMFMETVRRLPALERATRLQNYLGYLRENWNECGDPETKTKVAELSDPELGTRYFVHKSRLIAQKLEVACHMNPSEAIELLLTSHEELEALAKKMKVPELPSVFFDPLNVYVATWRPSRKVVALQTIEAIRHYAAVHNGQLPGSLDEIDLPIPADPFTGKVMAYKVGDEGAATLIMSNPPALVRNLEGTDLFEFKYRIRIATK